MRVLLAILILAAGVTWAMPPQTLHNAGRGAAWDGTYPEPIETDALLWYDFADDATRTQTGDSLTSIASKGTDTRAASLSTGTATMRYAEINELDVVELDDARLNLTGLTLGETATLLFIYVRETAGIRSAPASVVHVSGARPMRWETDNTYSVRWGAKKQFHGASTDTGVMVDLLLFEEGEAHRLIRNDEEQTGWTSTNTVLSSASTTGLTALGYNLTAMRHDGYLLEVIAWDYLLSPGEQAEVRKYGKDKWR